MVLEPVEQAIANTYVQISADLHSKGQMIPEADLWIAATALAKGYILVSRDNHFSRVERLTVQDWSQPISGIR